SRTPGNRCCRAGIAIPRVCQGATVGAGRDDRRIGAGMTGMSEMTDAVATRRAVLAGALGVGTLGALVPGFAGEAAGPIPTTPGDYFLRVDGMPGESLDDRHPDWIELLTFSWG